MRKTLDGVAVSSMVVLCLIWGLQQAAMKSIAADVAPLLQVSLRSGVAAVLVWVFGRLIVRDKWLKGVALGPGSVVGVLFAAEFLFVAEGLRWTTASHMAVFLYTAPMFAAVGLQLALPSERMTRAQWAGIAVSFVGIAVTFVGPGAGSGVGRSASNWMLGDLLGICAGAAWGMTTVAVRVTRLSEAPATQTLFVQLLWAFAVLLPFALFSGQSAFHGTTLVWASLGFQAVVVCFVSYVAWFYLLRVYLASRLGVLSFMAPLFGVALGALLLHERLEPTFLAGSALVLAGMFVVNGREWMKYVFARQRRDGKVGSA
ncbi:DMT family transporter [Paraburkholderia sp. Tr-20389]|uniref:DMT family transporter n=1 Tax=Paraburkholderia sp. Tr-20389 TaxID=2703903 RepID=UPI00197DE5BD|nr:DMT family transporter [Paraburkholderia sp. Tr-20389]MBN3751379.1 DMT family transporter [Paraburkholderia sp. Tr-20389]